MTVTDSPSAPPQQAAARVLVVDDNAANREILTRRLERRGIATAEAPDGESALRLIEEESFDLVFLDVMMPGLSGFDVLQRIRKDRPPTVLPVIMATANDGSEDIALAFELGANDYVTKPIDFTVAFARMKMQLEMVRAVRQVLELQDNLWLRNAELENALAALKQSTERTRRDLELAARVQSTFLPQDPIADPRYRAAWRFLPCEELAGDGLNICPLGPHHVAFYVLDVTGHGVASALTAVTAARMLAPSHDPASILIGPSGVHSPASVLNELATRFNFDSLTGQFITCFYALLDLRSGLLDFASAGHPDAIVVSPDGSTRLLTGTGVPTGLGDDYEQQTTQLRPGERVWLYSDGVIEALDADAQMLGIARLREIVAKVQSTPLTESTEPILADLEAWQQGGVQKDDVSLLTFEWLGDPTFQG